MHFKTSYVGTLLFFKKRGLFPIWEYCMEWSPHFWQQEPILWKTVFWTVFSKSEFGDGFKDDSRALCLLCILFLLLLLHQLHLKSSGIRSQRWGTPGLCHTLRPESNQGFGMHITLLGSKDMDNWYMSTMHGSLAGKPLSSGTISDAAVTERVIQVTSVV